jgi:hypothetical protein
VNQTVSLASLKDFPRGSLAIAKRDQESNPRLNLTIHAEGLVGVKRKLLGREVSIL